MRFIAPQVPECSLSAEHLAVEKEHQSETVAFLLMSWGVYGYPEDQALKVAIDVISDFNAMIENTSIGWKATIR